MKPHFLYGSLLAIVIISLFIPSNAQISSSGGSIRSNFNPSELEKYFGAGDVIRKIPLSPNNRTVGIEWVRDTLYVLSQPLNITLPAVLQKIDPIDGTIISQFSLPFAGFVLGITFDGKDLWIVKWNPNPEIYQIGTTGNLISSFPAPDAVVRGIAWDGQYLWVGEALNQIFYQVDTLGNVIKSVSWTNAPVWPMGLVWVTEHSAGHLWTNVDINDQIFQLNVDDTLSIIQNFTTPSPSLPEGICYDGEFLWVADFDTDTLWQVDDGIISSVENNENDIKIPAGKFAGKTLSEITNAIIHGVQEAYIKRKIPFNEIVLENKSEKCLGEFLQFKMMETIFLGHLLEINPFDQPNVEEYKVGTRRILEGE